MFKIRPSPSEKEKGADSGHSRQGEQRERDFRSVAEKGQIAAVWIFPGFRSEIVRLIVGPLESDRLADAVGVCVMSFKDVWPVQDPTEKEEVTS